MDMEKPVLVWRYWMRKPAVALAGSFLWAQLTKYGFVGVVVNLAGFIIYLLLTWKWLDPKMAVSLMYPIGAFLGYFGNSKFVFFYSGSHLSGLLRWFLAHSIGYTINIAILYTFVDQLGYPHPLIQAIAIFVVAGILFLLFRYYVFPQKALA